MIFPRDKINTIPLEYSRVKCYNGISMHLQMNSVTIIYQKYFCAIAVNYISSNVVKKYQHLGRAKKGCPRSPILATNRLNEAMHPVNRWTSLSLVGDFMFSIALIFSGFASIPRPETKKPRCFPDGPPNVHLSGLSFI